MSQKQTFEPCGELMLWREWGGGEGTEIYIEYKYLHIYTMFL